METTSERCTWRPVGHVQEVGLFNIRFARPEVGETHFAPSVWYVCGIAFSRSISCGSRHVTGQATSREIGVYIGPEKSPVFMSAGHGARPWWVAPRDPMLSPHTPCCGLPTPIIADEVYQSRACLIFVGELWISWGNSQGNPNAGGKAGLV